MTTFEQNLVLLNDVLRGTPLAERYWVIGGMLIGWAREGRILAHDDRDADFAYLREDHDALVAAIPALFAAGFRPLYRWISSAGEPVEYSLQKDGAKFEFFRHDPEGAKLRSYFFGQRYEDGAWRRFQYVGEVPSQQRAPFEFLGRTWQKPADHDAFLTAVYGDWRVPRPEHDYQTDDLSVIEKAPWAGTWEWNGEG